MASRRAGDMPHVSALVVDADTMRYGGGEFRRARTCRYVPDVGHSWVDDDDMEHETDLAGDDADMHCDRCGYTMVLDWFDEEEGEHGGWRLTPRFNYCPNCGAKVVKE